MKIRFPNPFGFTLPSSNRVKEVQKRYNFSDSYASFLLTQNGFFESLFLEDAGNEKYLEVSEIDGYAESGYFYSLDHDDKEYDLIKNNQSHPLSDYFFIIGTDYVGDEHVEILKGKHRGWIGRINHESYLGASLSLNTKEILEQMGLKTIGMSDDEICDELSNDRYDFLLLYARSMKDFTDDCFALCPDAGYGSQVRLYAPSTY